MKPDIYTNDERFYEDCYSLALNNSPVDDIFPSMVRYNTALFMLRSFWQNQYNAMKNRQAEVSYAASEEGWGRRLENLKTRAVPGEMINYAKSYVMKSEYVLFLCGGESVSFALLPWKQIQQQGIESRNDPDVVFYPEGSEITDHYKIHGAVPLQPDFFCEVDRRKYKIRAMELAVREVASLALLSYAYLNRAADCELLESMRSSSFNKSVLEEAKKILIQNQPAMTEVSPHGIWKKAGEMLNWFR